MASVKVILPCLECPIETPTEYSALPNLDLPSDFSGRLLQLFEGDVVAAQACVDQMAGTGPTAFRVNGLLTTAEKVMDELSSAGIETSALGTLQGVWTVPAESHRALTDSAAALEGRIYLMTPSSLLPGLCLDPQPGEEVLDLAAAPGGKTLHLADLMHNEGRIAAVESVKGRFHRLRRNLERCGAGIVDTYLTDGRGVWRKVPERFDRVLLDAPCSAEGRIVPGDPESWKFWSLKKIKEMVRKQRRLAESAVHCLKPGGLLVYCTCTLAPEENEAIVHRLLKRFGDALQVEGLPLPAELGVAGRTTWMDQTYDARLMQARRIFPAPPWEGFFIARLRKTASTIPTGDRS